MNVSNVSHKSNNRTTQSHTITYHKKGKGVIKSLTKKTVPCIYTEIKYSKHNTNYPGIPLLVCPICERNIFKLHRMKIATYAKALFLRLNLFNDSYNFFKCIDCGHTLIFSNDISYKEDTNITQTEHRSVVQ